MITWNTECHPVAHTLHQETRPPGLGRTAWTQATRYVLRYCRTNECVYKLIMYRTWRIKSMHLLKAPFRRVIEDVRETIKPFTTDIRRNIKESRRHKSGETRNPMRSSSADGAILRSAARFNLKFKKCIRWVEYSSLGYKLPFGSKLKKGARGSTTTKCDPRTKAERYWRTPRHQEIRTFVRRLRRIRQPHRPSKR